MTDRDVRDVLRVAFEAIEEEFGVSRSKSRACALKHLAALEGHGIRLARPAHLHDAAADWRVRREPGDAAAGKRAALAALNGTGTCSLCRTEQPLTGDGLIADHDIEDPALGVLGCLGAGITPDTTPADRSDAAAPATATTTRSTDQ